MVVWSSFIWVSYEKPSSSYYVMCYFWWGCRGNSILITLGRWRVKPTCLSWMIKPLVAFRMQRRLAFGCFDSSQGSNILLTPYNDNRMKHASLWLGMGFGTWAPGPHSSHYCTLDPYQPEPGAWSRISHRLRLTSRCLKVSVSGTVPSSSSECSTLRAGKPSAKNPRTPLGRHKLRPLTLIHQIWPSSRHKPIHHSRGQAARSTRERKQHNRIMSRPAGVYSQAGSGRRALQQTSTWPRSFF